MLVKEVFAADVTRDIAPVIYFHEQEPIKVLAEVSEYIITGGYPETDPRHRRIQSGIHEQFVRLLTSLAAELRKPQGTELPAVWISGFYGSGKSSFAKLLGLALDGVTLPDRRTVAEALLARDDSPKAKEFREAWEEVRCQIDPIAVVFDIGAVARDDEHIHSAVKRQVQARLGYCPNSYVANFELKLELDGKWDEFLAQAQKTLSQPWSELKDSQLADEDFSLVMHEMYPDRYIEPMTWYDSHIASQDQSGSSVAETTKAIAAMLRHRAPGKTLFLVVDEVSQYIYQNDNRMLKLQSFVADLGQKLKSTVWLFATGQQKLEDSDDESNIGKLKDRFPPKLRVHLDPANIRDVVHKRLLKKSATKEPQLRSLFAQHRSDLKLYGYSCDSITEEDFLEVYPMLPGYVDLLMQITSNLRVRSTRTKGDDYAIRGLLQLLGELFRTQNLGEQELGALVTLDSIFEVQQSALDADMQNTLSRVFSHPEVASDDMAIKVTKVVSLLELIQEQQPTTTKFISQCLYERLGRGNNESTVQEALDKLRDLGFISYSEKTGYKIQSSAGQEWQRERDDYGVTNDEISGIVSEKLKDLLGTVEPPSYKSKKFRWIAFYSDNRQRKDERLQRTTDLDVITIDFRYVTKAEDRDTTVWVQSSDSPNFRNRLIWVVSAPADVPSLARELARSRHICNRYSSRQQSLAGDKKRVWQDELTRCEGLEKQAKDAINKAFMDGELYFRGRQIDKREHGTSFATVLHRVGESILPDLYNQYIDIAITPTELAQLLEPTLSGPSSKFMQQGLGILELDAGKYVPTCNGQVPSRILQYITDSNGVGTLTLLSDFGGPPYGYSADVIKACLVGLLRAGKIRIRPEAGAEITSVRDPGTKDIFQKDRDFKRSDILPESGQGINARDRNKICKFFKDHLQVDLDRENDAIADEVFRQFPGRAKVLQELEKQYSQLPGRPELPDSLLKLRDALEYCTRSRQVEDTVRAVKKNLDALSDGIDLMDRISSELTEETVQAVRKAGEIQAYQVVQLKEIGRVAEVSEAVNALEEQLNLERPWRDISSIETHLQAICEHYKAVRLELINRQEQEAQEIQERIKRRKGFDRVSEDKGIYIVRPLQKARYDTTEEALYPRLMELRDTALLKLQKAEQEANDTLDNVLSQDEQVQVQVVQLALIESLRNREVSTEQEVEALVNELRDRLLAQLKENTRIRII